MRSVLEIITAALDRKEATDQELRWALVAVSYMLRMSERDARSLAMAVINDDKSAKLRAGSTIQHLNKRFESRRVAVDEYLGPENTPGTPENIKLTESARLILKKVTGIDLDKDVAANDVAG